VPLGQRGRRADMERSGPGCRDADRVRAAAAARQPAGHRAALIDLAAQLPAAVLADALNLSPGAAVRRIHQAGAGWNRYARGLRVAFAG
jgi:hypothetical protein